MKKITLFFTMLVLFAISWQGNAQVIIGAGSTTGKNVPVEPYYNYSYAQTIYLQTEIEGAGNITTLTWDFAGTSIDSSNDWTIYLGHTTKTEFTSDTDWVDVSTLTQVFSGTVTLDANNKVVVDITDFPYNNTDNLIIAVDENFADYDSYSDDFNCFLTASDRSIAYYDDNTNPDPTAPPTAKGTRNAAPNIILGGITTSVSAPNCAGIVSPTDGATAVSVDSANSNSVTLTWSAPTSGDAPSSYKVYWGTDANNLSDLGAISDTTALITNVNLSTTYYWSIVPMNAGGMASGCAVWSLTTEDPPPAPSNDLPAGAITLNLDVNSCGANTIVGISNMSTTDSGVAAPSCGSYGTPTDRGDLWYKFTVPAGITEITLNTTNVVTMTSVAGAYYSGTPGSLTEVACTAFSSGWPWALTGLTSGDTYYLRVWDYNNDQTGTFDLCGYYATCSVPTALTASNISNNSADLGWTSTETVFDVEVVTAGTAATGTPTDSGVSNPFTKTGLTDATDYEYYVRSDCSASSNGMSTWAGPFSFTTPLAPIVPDYLNDFATYPGAGWSEAVGAYGAPTGTASTWTDDDYGNDANHANGKCAKINIYNNSHDEYLISPQFDLSGGTYYLNMDLAFTEWGNSNPGVWDTDDYVALLVTQDGTTWTELTRWDASNTVGVSRTAVGEITLTGYNATTKFAFYAFSDEDNGPDNDFFIDNFQITQTPLSVANSVIEGFTMYPNPVNNTLRFNAQDTIENLSIFNLLGQEVVRTQPKVLHTQVDMSDLPTGMYVVKVQVGEQYGTYKIIKE